MTYSFACPLPCDYEITVHANNNDDAVHTIIMAGAMRCRNIEKNCRCEKARVHLPPVTAEQLRSIVRLCMKEEHDPSSRHAGGG
jgi:Cdc6-like AAA superfamily ATPase